MNELYNIMARSLGRVKAWRQVHVQEKVSSAQKRFIGRRVKIHATQFPPNE